MPPSSSTVTLWLFFAASRFTFSQAVWLSTRTTISLCSSFIAFFVRMTGSGHAHPVTSTVIVISISIPPLLVGGTNHEESRDWILFHQVSAAKFSWPSRTKLSVFQKYPAVLLPPGKASLPCTKPQPSKKNLMLGFHFASLAALCKARPSAIRCPACPKRWRKRSCWQPPCPGREAASPRPSRLTIPIPLWFQTALKRHNGMMCRTRLRNALLCLF